MSRKYQKLTLYYFSGTGNARNCAHWIADEAKSRGLQTTVYNIDRNADHDIPMKSSGSMIGFCGPTHGFSIAPSMLKFIRKFPRGCGRDVFILNTRAGMKLWKIFTPGLSGVALILPALILLLKGYRIKALKPVDLPSNWISVHPGVRQKVTDSIYDHWEKNVRQFANIILDGKRVLRGLYDLPVDLLISPIAVLYALVGRYALAKTFYASHKCTKCNLCVDKCPVGAIKMKNGYPFWKYNCESCMRCMNTCPEKAIQTTQGVTIAAWIVFSGLISTFIISPVQISLGDMNPTLFALIEFVIKWWVSLAAIFLLYELLHLVSGFKIVRKFFSHLTFTILPVWRRVKVRKRY